MPSLMRPVLMRSALLGLASGGRSMMGLAALALTTRPSGGMFASPWIRRLAGIAAAGEILGDKLPQAPSRLQPEGLVPRLATGAVTAAILSHREGAGRDATALAAATGLAAAAAGSWLGVSWRRLAGRRFASDLPGALIEDATWIATAHYAIRRRG